MVDRWKLYNEHMAERFDAVRVLTSELGRLPTVEETDEATGIALSILGTLRP